MATSLQYNFMGIDADNIIREAFERCGVSQWAVDRDKYIGAKRSLNFILTHLPNKGLNLFTVDQQMIPIIPGVPQYALPVNTSKILECKQTTAVTQLGGVASSSEGGDAAGPFSGSLVTPCTQVAPDGNISYLYPTGTPILYVGVMSFVTDIYELVIECSYLNAPADEDWITLLKLPALEFYYMETQWFPLPSTKNAVNWRIREVGGATLNIAQIFFAIPNISIMLAARGRDMYFESRNNNKASNGSTTYWMSRTNQPILNVYPVPAQNTTYQFFVYNRVRYIQDVGEFYDSLDINSRFLESLTATLATYIAERIPGFDPNNYDRLMARADRLYIEAGKEDYEDVDTIFEYTDDGTGYR